MKISSQLYLWTRTSLINYGLWIQAIFCLEDVQCTRSLTALVGYAPICINDCSQYVDAAAWLIMRTSRRENITPVLMEVRWLSVRRRVEFKQLRSSR